MTKLVPSSEAMAKYGSAASRAQKKLTPKMNPRVKALWVEALESGEYSQATDALRSGDSFCCLGVLTDLYHKETGDGTWSEHGDSVCSFVYTDEDDDAEGTSEEEGELPTVVAKWAGLQSFNPHVVFSGVDSENPESEKQEMLFCLSEINDGETNNKLDPQDFEVIASVIKEQL